MREREEEEEESELTNHDSVFLCYKKECMNHLPTACSSWRLLWVHFVKHFMNHDEWILRSGNLGETVGEEVKWNYIIRYHTALLEPVVIRLT